MKKNLWTASIAGFLLMAAVIAGCGSDSTTPAANKSAGKTTTYLFVQDAASGTFVDDGNGSYILTLHDVSPQTVYFSDRPVRDAGQVEMRKFLASGCFNSENPPNAAINVMNADQAHDVVIVELLDPVYDAETATLKYSARMLKDENLSVTSLDARRDSSIPASFGAVALFIDSCPDRTVHCGHPGGGTAGTTSKVGSYIAGTATCCTCWGWLNGCDFQEDCCSFEQCQQSCTDKYGDENRYLFTCERGGWVDNYEDWEKAWSSSCLHEPFREELR